MKGQLNLFEPEFIKDIDCTVDTPVTRGNKDKPIYGTGKRIKPRVPGRRETKHISKAYECGGSCSMRLLREEPECAGYISRRKRK